MGLILSDTATVQFINKDTGKVVFETETTSAEVSCVAGGSFHKVNPLYKPKCVNYNIRKA